MEVTRLHSLALCLSPFKDHVLEMLNKNDWSSFGHGLLVGREWVVGRSFKTRNYVIPKENWNVDIKRDGRNAGETSTVGILRQLLKV